MNNTSSKDLMRDSLTSMTFHDSELLGWMVAILLTNGFGAVANFILLLTLAVHRPLRQSSSCALIAHCLLIDLFTTIVTVPTSTVPVYLGPLYELPKIFCKNQAVFVYFVYAAGMYASSMVALHRLTAAIAPHHFFLLTKKSAIFIMILLPWIFTMTLNIFPTVEIGLKVILSNLTGACLFVSTSTENKLPLLLYTTFGIYLPTVIMGVSYAIILGTSFDVHRKMATRGGRVLQRRLEISRMLFLSFLWHCFTIYPTNIMIAFFAKTFESNYSLQLGIKWLGNSFSAINPVFYWISSKMFQDGIKEVLACRWLEKRNQNSIKPLSVFGVGHLSSRPGRTRHRHFSLEQALALGSLQN